LFGFPYLERKASTQLFIHKLDKEFRHAVIIGWSSGITLSPKHASTPITLALLSALNSDRRKALEALVLLYPSNRYWDRDARAARFTLARRRGPAPPGVAENAN
jgi:hypothetical protein